MHVSHLGLTNYRNFARLEMDFPTGPIILWGDNGHGKSNLLESIFFLATTRSPFASSDRQLVHWLAWREKQPFARLTARVERLRGALRLEMVVKGRGSEADWALPDTEGPGVSKRIRINHVARRAIDALGEFQVVMFHPQDLDIVSGSPSDRRRYLDVANSQLDHRYARTLSRLNRVLLHRNSLLRRIRDEGARSDQLEFWNQQLVELGAYAILQRGRFIADVGPLADTEHRRLTGGRKGMQVAYLAAMGQKASLASEDLKGDSLEQRLQSALEKEQTREIAAGVSLVGPHRDDLQFKVDGVDMTCYGSRGEQRTVALALKLAEAAYFLTRTNDRPVLLLDDVLSELDPDRRGHLLTSLQTDQQAFLTTTSPEGLPARFLGQSHVIRVIEGRLELQPT
ncbi:MAG: DNA replication/repair protein RecF [Dehalococcoidia bacterium]|nr:DNA replication/repair protein RecF [Dehalococcoidia bacterium]